MLNKTISAVSALMLMTAPVSVLANPVTPETPLSDKPAVSAATTAVVKGRIVDANNEILPGAYIRLQNNEQGEARFGQVRGTSPDLSSVTVNGNRMPSAEGDVRQVQLDLIPSDMIQTIEVNKVVTSDMDGDAIGGSVNLVTKNSPYKRVFSPSPQVPRF